MPAGVSPRYPRPRICTTQKNHTLAYSGLYATASYQSSQVIHVYDQLAIHQYPTFEAAAARHSMTDKGD